MKTSILLCCTFILCLRTSAQPPAYPETHTENHIDTYFGTNVADPFRWLEDDTTAAVGEWVKAQNEVTGSYMERIPYRRQIRARLEELYDYPRYSAPAKKGRYYVYTRNKGLQNQAVVYIQKGLNAAPSVLIDPNLLSTDGTTRLTTGVLSNDTKYYAYGLSHNGSDWMELFVMHVADRNILKDHIEWVKVSGISWRGNGFYYSRYEAPEQKEKAYSSRNEDHRVYYHRIGTQQEDDRLIYGDPLHPQRFHIVSVTDDERFLVLNISDRGTGRKGNAFFVRDLRSSNEAWVEIVKGFDDSFRVLDNIGDKLLVSTDRNAPNRKVVLIDPAHPKEEDWKLILPEAAQPLASISTAGGKIFATYMKDVSHRVHVYDLNGTFENEVVLPGLGTVGGFDGEPGQKQIFYTFTSLTYPPTIFSYNIASRRSRVYRKSEVLFNPADFETRQVFFTSTTVGKPNDNPKIPLFVVSKKGMKLDGTNPTILYGYGGFNVSLNPSFNPLLIAWLEQGGVYARANLRGGGEYGEEWHQAGTRLNKQNVFNDFIAAAEWLIANKYTSPQKLAMQGGSNGGLLVGAVMNQRPDLFKVALPAVGVMDMLRFHKFTIGWNWIPDYGSADNETDFRNLYAYSPLHNIRLGPHPATLVTTADHDDRVVPAHSFKYVATLQAHQQGDNPVLIRIETKSGHGSSSTRKRIEETADEFSFSLWNMGVVPKF